MRVLNETTASHGPGEPVDVRWGNSRRFWCALTVGVVGGAVLAVLSVRSNGVISYGDQARFAWWSSRALQDWPLVGVPTTADLYGGGALFQPGPIETYAMYPFVRTFGLDLGPQAFAAATNSACALAAAWAASLVGGRRAAVGVAAASVVVMVATIPGHVTDALNVYIVVLPLFACFVLAWPLAAGRPNTAVPLVLTSTFVVQTHIAYGFSALLVSAVAVVAFLVHGRRAGFPDGWHLPVLSSLALGVILWLPPLLDLWMGDGNLANYLATNLPKRGLGGALNVVLVGARPGLLLVAESSVAIAILLIGAFVLWRLVTRRSPRLGAPVAAVPLAVAAWTLVVSSPFKVADVTEADLVARRWSGMGFLIAGCAWFWWFRRGHAALLLTVAAVTGSSAAVGAMLPPDAQPPYHLLFVRPAVLFVCFAALWVTGAVQHLRLPKWLALRPELVAVGLLAVAWASYLRSPLPLEADSREMIASKELLRQLDDELPADASCVVLSRGGTTAYLIAATVIANLDRGARQMTSEVDDFDPDCGLVVVQGVADQRRAGKRIATFGSNTESSAKEAREIGEELASLGEVQVDPRAGQVLSTFVDGSAPALCLERLANGQDAPNHEVVAGLLAEAWITAPTPSEDLIDRVERWAAARPASVRRLSAEHLEEVLSDLGRSSNPLVISRASCASS